jgi:adenosylcobinamide-phosphate synthase
MSTTILLTLLLALLLDRIVGDPDFLWRRLPHPVAMFGKAITALDRRLNRQTLPASMRKRNGVIAIVVLLAASFLAGVALHLAFALLGPAGLLVEAVFAAVFLAQKSLADHVRAVAVGLRQQGLAGGRLAVSMIVGRDPDTLDAPAVCRAAIESLAENFSDGVVAPAFWYALLGLPGLLAYKMLNTADSMIGHKSEQYLDFGWASARLDDLANWLPARLSLLLIAGGGLWTSGRAGGRNALRAGLRDHGLHRSPNSGWPEAAMAGALDIRLAGPRIYAGEMVREPMLNGAGRAVAGVDDVDRGIAVFNASCSLLAAAVLLLMAMTF